ncbi:MAG: hypothetical protein R8N50_03720, partial [Alphaproteobacteria bacterium]|nr:hypothetical protein [Alphaproteobacteria bacterium]
VAGDMILSTGVNAAAGAVVGNIVASGDSVLRIEPCTVDGRQTKCLWGYYEEYGNMSDKTAYVSYTNPNAFRVSDKDGKNCQYQNLNVSKATIAGYDFNRKKRSGDGWIDIETVFAEDKFEIATEKYCYKDGKMEKLTDISGCSDIWVKLGGTVNIISNRKAAMVVDVKDKAFGWKKSEWNEFLELFGSNEVVGRTGNGIASSLSEKKVELQGAGFTPVYQDSEDGSIIELGNKARMKGTLTGAGVGGGMGAFSAYQGAQQDIDARWVSAVQEYRNSLQKIYCATGTRYLSQYNDMVTIPNIVAE